MPLSAAENWLEDITKWKGRLQKYNKVKINIYWPMKSIYMSSHHVWSMAHVVGGITFLFVLLFSCTFFSCMVIKLFRKWYFLSEHQATNMFSFKRQSSVSMIANTHAYPCVNCSVFSRCQWQFPFLLYLIRHWKRTRLGPCCA